MAEKQPAYFLVRLDSSKSASDWLFLCYVPDGAPIRQKMIYAATRASLTKDLGDSYIKDSIYGTIMVRTRLPPYFIFLPSLFLSGIMLGYNRSWTDRKREGQHRIN